jgi:uncharacterized protein involved in response to NO
MATVSLHRTQPPTASRPGGLPFLSAGFRPFFLLAAAWAAIAVPAWLAAYAHGYAPSDALPAQLWHAHEMVFGFGLAVVTGFLLTAIPNWTGRLPVRGAALASLALLWIAGRVALLTADAATAAFIDLAFPAAAIFVVARELLAGRNLRNLPMLAALGLLFSGSLLVHLHANGIAYHAALGNRIGIATLLALIALVGGRIVPSFTRNWLAKMRPEVAPPAQASGFDLACMLIVVAGLAAWVVQPASEVSSALEIAAGMAAFARLSRWRGVATVREPLVFILHLGYGWLAAGLLLLGLGGFFEWLPAGAPLHALTVGAIGTMTLAVMTRASLGHGGRPLVAGGGTLAIYALVALAALLRVAAPLTAYPLHLTSLAGLAWCAAFALFAVLFGPLLLGEKK